MDLTTFGMAGVAAITVICYLAATAVKQTPLANKWLPTICGTLGGLVTLFACATPVSVVITNWFVDKRSSVLAFIMGGYGFGGMIILPIVGRLIAA